MFFPKRGKPEPLYCDDWRQIEERPSAGRRGGSPDMFQRTRPGPKEFRKYLWSSYKTFWISFFFLSFRCYFLDPIEYLQRNFQGLFLGTAQFDGGDITLAQIHL